MSHPTRVRGLKLGDWKRHEGRGVAPHTGAWIETGMRTDISFRVMSHPTRVRGLKQLGEMELGSINGRTPHGCVD